MFTFGYTLRRPLGEYVDESQPHMAVRMVWDRRQGFGQLRFGRRKGRNTIDRKEKCAFDYVRACRSNERVNIVGIGGEREVEKAASLRNIVGGYTLIEPSQTLKIEVDRVGGRSFFRASRLSDDKLGVQSARQARYDFILHVKEISEGLVEPLGPEMIDRFGVDKLHVDAYAVSAALNATIEDVADVQFAPNRLRVDGSGKFLVCQAASGRSVAVLNRPSSTAARTIATQWAPRGDHRIRCFLAMRALAISSTQPSARDVEIGSSDR